MLGFAGCGQIFVEIFHGAGYNMMIYYVLSKIFGWAGDEPLPPGAKESA